MAKVREGVCGAPAIGAAAVCWRMARPIAAGVWRCVAGKGLRCCHGDLVAAVQMEGEKIFRFRVKFRWII